MKTPEPRIPAEKNGYFPFEIVEDSGIIDTEFANKLRKRTEKYLNEVEEARRISRHGESVYR